MIEFKDVVKEYSNKHVAANHISLKINQGEFVYIVGPSGAGKSTFIKMIYREEKPTSGTIQVNEYHLEKMHDREVPHLRRHLGVVFQDFKLLPKKTVFENVAYALEVIERKPADVKRRVSDVLKLVGLENSFNKFPSELSGGEQQRVAIARALANKPYILVADEPTGNLDPKTAEDVINILEKANQQGTTIIMATHNDIIVNEHRHRLIEFNHGKIIRDEQGGAYQDEKTNA